MSNTPERDRANQEALDKGQRCYECMQRRPYLFDDSRCADCTHLTPEQIRGDEL